MGVECGQSGKEGWEDAGGGGRWWLGEETGGEQTWAGESQGHGGQTGSGAAKVGEGQKAGKT